MIWPVAGSTTSRLPIPSAPWPAATSAGDLSVAVRSLRLPSVCWTRSVTVRPAFVTSSPITDDGPKKLNARPSTRSIVSPTARPAASAGEPGVTYVTRTPAAGSPARAIPAKIAKASARFIATPEARIPTLVTMPWAANDLGSSASPPSSPSSLTPLSRRTVARGGKPTPNSITRTFAMRAATKWPSSWMTTVTPRMRTNRRIVTIAWGP